MIESTDMYCFYSDLPSPKAYMKEEQEIEEHNNLSLIDINRIIEMAWEDRTPFDAIKAQFGLSENVVKAIMKKELKFSSYVLWRKRVGACSTKHAKKRNAKIIRFKSSSQRTITSNKLSKRNTK